MHGVLAVEQSTANVVDGIVPVLAGLFLLVYGLFGKDRRTKARIAGRTKVVLVVCGVLVLVIGLVRFLIS
jgi:hypothetical protein